MVTRKKGFKSALIILFFEKTRIKQIRTSKIISNQLSWE